MVGADIEPANIVTHDEKDIWLLLRGLGVGCLRCGNRQQRDCDREHRAADRFERPPPYLTRCLRVRGRLATHDVSSSSFGLVFSRGRHRIRRQSICNRERCLMPKCGGTLDETLGELVTDRLAALEVASVATSKVTPD